ncbi:MAG: hypothetical protein R3A46_00525 [Thermomicrobiales bacterium]
MSAAGRFRQPGRLLAGFALVVAAVTGVMSSPGTTPATAQTSPICQIEFAIDVPPTLELAAGQSTSLPFQASITVRDVSTAFVSIFVGTPLNMEADFSPADQVIVVEDPATTSIYNVVGNVNATVPGAAETGQSWTFSPNTATLTCEGIGTGAALQDSDSHPPFQIVAQAPVPTATSTATATYTATPTATSSPTPVPTATPTPTPTATATATPSPTTTPTATATPSPSATATLSATASPTASATATERPSPSATVTATATSTRSSPTATLGERQTPVPVGTPTFRAATATEPPSTPTEPEPPPTESSNDGLALELSEVRQSASVDHGDERTTLRAALGVLGAIALASGMIGMWIGFRRVL